jgi:hypothetical protein
MLTLAAGLGGTHQPVRVVHTDGRTVRGGCLRRGDGETGAKCKQDHRNTNDLSGHVSSFARITNRRPSFARGSNRELIGTRCVWRVRRLPEDQSAAAESDADAAVISSLTIAPPESQQA